MAFKHNTVLAVAMVYVFAQTRAVGAMSLEPYMDEDDPEKINTYDVGIVPLEGGGQAFVDVDTDGIDNEDTTKPNSSFAEMSSGEDYKSGEYMYHLERFIHHPEVQYYIAEMKANFHAYVNKVGKEIDFGKEIEQGEPKYENDESVAATEIQIEFHHCLQQRFDTGVPGIGAYRCCGKQLWKNTKQRLARMEASLQEYQMIGK